VSQKFIERLALCALEWHVPTPVTPGPEEKEQSPAARTWSLNMPGGSRLPPIAVNEEEQRQLEAWSRQRGTERALALRARIVLSCRDGHSNREVARRTGVTIQTVGKWRGRFLSQRLHGLLDQPRSGAPRSISDAIVETVLAKTLHEQPPDAARWSSRRLATALGISQRAVLRIWRTFDL